jgi:hypothetical protein
MNQTLLDVTLWAFDGSIASIAALRGVPLRAALDVDRATMEVDKDDRPIAHIGFVLLLEDPQGELAAELSATFRLTYGAVSGLEHVLLAADPAEARDFTAGRAAADAWPYWLTFLQGTMASMGLVPLRLPAAAPAELAEPVRRAFDRSAQGG